MKIDFFNDLIFKTFRTFLSSPSSWPSSPSSPPSSPPPPPVHFLMENIIIVEADRSTVSLAVSHFRQVLARTKTTALPRARSTSSPIGGS